MKKTKTLKKFHLNALNCIVQVILSIYLNNKTLKYRAVLINFKLYHYIWFL